MQSEKTYRPPTKHQERIQSVRARLNKVVKYVPHEKRRGGLTPFGTFAEKMCEIAKERDVWPWRQTTLTTSGVPKDLSTGLRAFAQGKHGASEAVMNLIELTCLHYEMEHRRAVSAASGVPAPILRVVEPEEAAQAVTEDPEITALYAIKAALDDLDTEARKRVLQWSADKFGLEFVVKPRVPHA